MAEMPVILVTSVKEALLKTKLYNKELDYILSHKKVQDMAVIC